MWLANDQVLEMVSVLGCVCNIFGVFPIFKTKVFNVYAAVHKLAACATCFLSAST
jgi:hypothetical protein